ncbi:MAG: PAQR family membrane homeostasis protein TrhA [Promethearchaeota archaeon]
MIQAEISKKEPRFIQLPEERFSCYSHMVGAIFTTIGTIILVIISAGDIGKILVSILYGLSITFLFFASTMYHAHKRGENEKTIWRKLDHIAIFVMIAGSYSPISFIYLTGGWRIGILIAQWSLVILGIVLKLIIINTPRWITIAIYLLQGWMAVLPLYLLFKEMPLSGFLLMALGGISFTIGAIIYALKKPDPIPGVFGFHEIFHVLILIGAGLHYAMVWQALV